MKEIPDELWNQIMTFVRKVDDGTREYMETWATEDNVYSDAERILEAVAKLHEERGR